MGDFRIAVKSFIVDDGRVLLIKRRSDDVHKPDEWDIPGGRMELDEDPLKGVKRETTEEVGIDIDVIMPLKINHFVRDDGQRITMIMFLCKALSKNIKLSEEHVDFKWKSLREDIDLFPKWLRPAVDNFLRFKLDDGMDEI